jgi:membrane protein implicated in regulation of membrane protease activity
MRIARWTLFWCVVIAVLVLVELAELTRVFTIPISSAVLSPLPFVFSLVFITILALVGAVFVGFYLSSQVYSSRGFTPFEQEMLRMRHEVSEIREELDRLRSDMGVVEVKSPRNEPTELPRVPAPKGRDFPASPRVPEGTDEAVIASEGP